MFVHYCFTESIPGHRSKREREKTTVISASSPVSRWPSLKNMTRLVQSLGSRDLKQNSRRQRQQAEKIEALMNNAIAVHVRYKSLYISLPSFAKQQRERLLAAFWRTQTVIFFVASQ